jgi:hypothetical protein
MLKKSNCPFLSLFSAHNDPALGRGRFGHIVHVAKEVFVAKRFTYA